jgi:hypothetical protein
LQVHPNEQHGQLGFVRAPRLPIVIKSGEAAFAAAERRWSADLHRQFASKPVTYGEIIGAIDEQMRAAATEAEKRRRGAGLERILRELKLVT